MAALFRPMQAETVALSPDGARLAYTQHERGELAIYIAAVDRSERRFRIAVEDDRPTPLSREKTPARLRFLRWATPTRLVFAPTEYQNGVRPTGSVFAVNHDGTAVQTLARADDFVVQVERAVFNRRTIVRGFVPGNRQTILIEAIGPTFPPGNPLSVPTSLFTLDVGTGKLTEVSNEYDGARFFYDRTGRARLQFTMPWVSPERAFSFKTPGKWDRWVDADERWLGPLAKHLTVTTENYFGERVIPLGFGAEADLLYFASNVGRDTYGVYAFDLRTRQRTELAIEEPHVDLAWLEPNDLGGGLVFDEARGHLAGVRAVGVTPFARWVDAEIAAVQREVDERFPERTVEILQWDDARRRFLLRVSGGIEPGRYHVFQRPENVVVEMLRRAPWLRNAELQATQAFAFETKSGARLSGYLTLPRKPRLNPPPLLIEFADGLMGRAPAGFDPEAQALADMGFLVARLNHRGAAGFGRKHRDAIHGGIDRVPVDDALAAIEWLGQRHAIDRRRVAAVGRGYGGYLALRALQLEPEVFRCAVAIQAPLNPHRWLAPPLENFGRGPDQPAIEGTRPQPPPPPERLNFLQQAQRLYLERGGARLQERSVLRAPERITKPVMLLVAPERDREIGAQNLELRGALKGTAQPATYFEVEPGYLMNLPGARAKAFRAMEEFFNLNLYDYNVKVGPVREVK